MSSREKRVAYWSGLRPCKVCRRCNSGGIPSRIVLGVVSLVMSSNLVYYSERMSLMLPRGRPKHINFILVGFYICCTIDQPASSVMRDENGCCYYYCRSESSQNVSKLLVYERICEKLHISHMFCFTLNCCQLPIDAARLPTADYCRLLLPIVDS